jgi:hypothetical protein
VAEPGLGSGLAGRKEWEPESVQGEPQGEEPEWGEEQRPWGMVVPGALVEGLGSPQEKVGVQVG